MAQPLDSELAETQDSGLRNLSSMTTAQLIASAGDKPETSVRRDQIEAILRLRAYKGNLTAASDRRATSEVERASAASLAESAPGYRASDVLARCADRCLVRHDNRRNCRQHFEAVAGPYTR